jgi:hypothetical protein
VPIVVPAVDGGVGRFPRARCFGRRILVVAVPIAVLVVGCMFTAVPIAVLVVGCMFTAVPIAVLVVGCMAQRRILLVNPVGHAPLRSAVAPATVNFVSFVFGYVHGLGQHHLCRRERTRMSVARCAWSSSSP